jgi:beta-glucosidase
MDNFGDRVKYYFTINEPQCFIGLSNSVGKHAPGLKLSERDLIHMIHHTLLAHGKAVKVIRDAKPDAQIGFAPVGHIMSPKTASKEDLELARNMTFAIGQEEMDISEVLWSSASFNDPAFLGTYPSFLRRKMDKYISGDIDADLKIICQPMDFIGVNIYQGNVVGQEAGEAKMMPYPQGHPTTKMGWPVTEDVIYYGPKFLYERYQKPVYITENGLSMSDWISLDGKVHDPNRIDFLSRYIGRLEDAVNDGTKVAGYFQWSLMDNFEWAEGYKDRFGLIYVDYTSGKRTLKDSAYWYKEVITSNFKI